MHYTVTRLGLSRWHAQSGMLSEVQSAYRCERIHLLPKLANLCLKANVCAVLFSKFAKQICIVCCQFRGNCAELGLACWKNALSASHVPRENICGSARPISSKA